MKAITKIHKTPVYSAASNVIEEKITRMRKATQLFATYSQETVDHIFHKAAIAAEEASEELAKIATEETQMGIVKDKTIKNHFSCTYIYEHYKDIKTCGMIDENPQAGVRKYAIPVGIIGAFVPATNPTSTTIFKALCALKTKNGVIFSPHPHASRSTIETIKVIMQAAVEAGAPEGILDWIEEPTFEKTEVLMQNVDMVLVTGNPHILQQASNFNTPVVSIGAGSAPIIVHHSGNLAQAVSRVIKSKSFDYGLVSTSDQTMLADNAIFEELKMTFLKKGAHIASAEECEKIRKIMFIQQNNQVVLNPDVIGQTPQQIAAMAGFKIDEEAHLIVCEVTETNAEKEVLVREKLSAILTLYRYYGLDDLISQTKEILNEGHKGYATNLFIDQENYSSDIELLKHEIPSELRINAPAENSSLNGMLRMALRPAIGLESDKNTDTIYHHKNDLLHLVNIMSRTRKVWSNCAHGGKE